MFQSAAFQVVLELAVHVIRLFPALLRQMDSDYRVMLFDNPIEKGLLGTVALVTTRIPLPGGRPCDTVFLYSLSLDCYVIQELRQRPELLSKLVF